MALIICCSPISSTSFAVVGPVQARNSVFTMMPYDRDRIGYESLPVKLIGLGGGRLSPDEKLKIFASMLKNDASKNVRAVRFRYFVFRADNLDEAIQTDQTEVIPVQLPALEKLKVQIHVVNIDDVSSLAYKQGAKFHLEVAVNEVHYDDGSLWQATDLPAKQRRFKTH